MNEDQDDDNGDYDREDLEHVENLLYANIHYNAGCEENQLASANQSTPQTEANSITDHSASIEANRRHSAPRRNAKRYWSNTGDSTPNFVPYYKEKQSGIYRAPKVTTNELNDSVPENAKSDRHHEPVAAVTPKQYTPYISFLPLNDSIATDEEEPRPTTSKAIHTAIVKTNNALIRKTISANVKHVNPFSKKDTIDTYKNLNESNQLNTIKILENKKRLNPFNETARKAKKKKTDCSQAKSVRKNREELKQIAANANVIDVDEVDDDDDDVIVLPTEEPPLICVDSSDDETIAETNVEEHEFTEPTAVSESRRKATRCASPSSSIQSADDFIAQSDQGTYGFDTFGTLSDEDLCHVSESVENQLRNKGAQSNEHAAISTDNDIALFTPPKQMHKDKTKAATKKSYEVGANSFTAVDVYESESSDMPDSIYAKGAPGKRKNVSDSDASSVENGTVYKSKRLIKRKRSSSAKESDMHSDDSSSDLPEVDDDTDDDAETNENSYLVRGEALGKVKNSNKKKKTNTNLSEKQSENDFINKLSSIVHGRDESDENDEPGSQRETSAESVEARDIVQTVLQRRTKKSKKNQEIDTEPTQTENDNPNNWTITDQIGETDELNLGKIFNESDLVDDNKSQHEETTSIGINKIANENVPVSNEPNQKNQSNKEPIQMISTETIKASEETNQTATDDADDDIFKTEIGWNDEMQRFYNESWGGETFSIKNIRARMPKGHLNWMIINKDKFPSSNNTKGRQFRCLNCQEKGHLAKNCPKPPGKKHCYMCGVEGHLEPRCPNKICLLCGKKSQRYQRGCVECGRDRNIVCHVCRQRGHKQMQCPDRWRRYHSTTTTKIPLIQEQKRPSNQQKQRHCCICGKSGHYADQCSQSHRWDGPLSTRVMSYKPLFHQIKSNENQNTAPKCTIFTSDIDDYNFNFDNDVLRTGNTIYARFCRATNKNEHNQSKASENDVTFVSESNVSGTSERPIEVYDDFEVLDELDDISSTDKFSENTQDDSFMIIDSLEEQDQEQETASLTDVLAEKEQAINKLDGKIETLERLKGEMLLHKSSDEICDQNMTDQDTTTESEQNVSEPKQRREDDITTSKVLLDFIPLTSDQPAKFEPARSPSPIPADSTTTSNEKSDANIHLTREHCAHLMTESGGRFLRKSESQFNVSVRMQWEHFGNVLIVTGIASNQQNFHDELRAYFDSCERKKAPKAQLNLPKNRDALIKYVRNQFAFLDSPFCNAKPLSDVKEIFRRIRFNERNPSKAAEKKNTNLRKQLNSILFGIYGFGEGRTHLDKLQDDLRFLINFKGTNVPMNIREKMSEHIEYLFSGNENHENYENLIDHYTQLKRDNCLPEIKLDRKLLGLRIDVLPKAAQPTSSGRRPRYSSPSSVVYSHLSGSCTPNASSINTHNRLNATPSSNDIQINVSAPSTSTSYYDQNYSFINDFSL